MAEEDASVNNLFKEIDEELRQDKATLLWKQYGSTLIAAIVAVVIAVAGYEGWKAYDMNKREKLGNQYAAALELARQNNFDEASTAFQALAGQGSGYSALARMQAAGLLAQQGKEKEASDAYFLIAQNGEIDPIFRDMALILGTLNGLDTMEGADIVRRLETLAAGANPWRHSAQEIIAFAEAKAGNTAKAAEMMKTLAEDASAPPGVRQRAGEFAQAYAN
ncbi:tetratricopeptide repeat protein [Terasakiella sp. SH-1]|uniref:tetratricopeptide repeat protein n=1 Tax=Terasakiella sp. SH-1 TaxID=2560057 RepID=UPI0010742F80|nr:tetratricopeptide repeat protein [Terasakiella sp. SH-1]